MSATLLELLGLPAVLLLAAVAGRVRLPGLQPLRSRWTRLGNRKLLSVSLVGMLGFGVSAAASAVRVPVPCTHDEFSYLLAADTFAHGRVTNPTHPGWRHFETFHVIHNPSYASKYPPVQGLLLALGTVLGGHPVVGVWLGMGLASAAVCWMLQGWLPGRWALFGGLIVALHPGLQLTWGYSYWGGAIPMTGGALLFGALPRVLRACLPRYGVPLALGAVILANSRPFEGLVVCLPVVAALLWHLRTGRLPLGRFAQSVVPPAFGVLLLAGIGMAYYNTRVTGSPTKMPYQVHEATYGACPLFLWQELPCLPEYRHQAMSNFHVNWALPWFTQQQQLAGLVRTKLKLMAALWKFFCHFTLTLPLLMGAMALGRSDVRFALGTLALATAASAMVPWLQPHYLAPVIPLLWLLIVQGWRRLRCCSLRGAGFGRNLALGLMVLYLALFAVKMYQHWTEAPAGWYWQRAHLEEQLTAQPGKHLVFVHYSQDHHTLEEWVYNQANIDAARIVWARSMSPQEDRRLLTHFPDRRVWLLDADARPPRVRRVVNPRQLSTAEIEPETATPASTGILAAENGGSG